MKWTNKGHQFDVEAKKILKLFNQKNVSIYGAGLYGSELYRVLKKYQRFSGFIDASIEKQISGFEGEKVYSPQTYLLNCNDVIVICASETNGKEIKEILLSHNKEYLKDFFFMQEFDEYYWPIMAAYYYESCYVPLAQIVLTNRCTLKCEKCAHGCQTSVGKEDLNLQQVKYSMDTFFNKVHYIRKFDLIGGEPLLYCGLSEVVEYIGENYLQQIGCLEITTNGTVLPSERLLDTCHEFGVVFNISDYSHQVSLAMKQRKALIKQLEIHQVKHRVTENQIWVDYGFDRGYNSNLSENRLIQFYQQCKTPCREIRENKYYYCVAARTSSQAFDFNYDTEEFLEFNKLEADYQKIILEFNLGYNTKGYLEACKRCLGGFRFNEQVIPVAVQKI